MLSVVLAITDGDKAKADRLATEIAQKFISMRAHAALDSRSVEDGTDTAIVSTSALS